MIRWPNYKEAVAWMRANAQILASVAEFERQLICERTLAGVRAARAHGKALGRPRRVFRRDEAVRLRAEGLSWRSVAQRLRVPVSTVVDACRCTEIVPTEARDGDCKPMANDLPA